MAKRTAFLAPSILCLVILAIVGVFYLYLRHFPPGGTAPIASSAQVQRQPVTIVDRISTAPSSQMDAIVDGIWRLAALDEGAMANGLPAWLGPLLRDHRYADVEAMSLVALLHRAWDPTDVADFEEARVRALLAEGKYARALSEAKSNYNVAMLWETPTAEDLLRQAWCKANGLSFVDASEIRGILHSVKVDGSQLQPAIDGTRQGSPYKFANQTSQGDLLLLADHPAEAQQSFLKGCEYVEQNWDLTRALEGIAESVRDQSGSPDRALALTRAWAAGQTSAVGIALPDNISSDDLREAAKPFMAGMAPIRQELPLASADSLSPVGLPPPGDEGRFSMPVNDPIILARMCPQSDPELRVWLDQWQQDFRGGKAIDDQQLDSLRQILMQSKVPEPTLLAMLDSFHAISGDANTSNAWLTICARRIDPALADWLSRQSQRTPAQDQQISQLSDLAGRAGLSCESLYQFAQAVNDIGGDQPTAAAICVAAVTRGHQELSQYKSFDDSMRPILWAMKKCEYVLWDEEDTHGQSQYVDAIDTLAKDLNQWVPDNDPSLGWMRIWAKVSMAECASGKGDCDRALAILDSIQLGLLPPNQQDGVVWAKAMALLHKGQDTLAIEQLKICAGNKAFGHSGAAWQILASTYSKLGKQRDAHQAFDYWVRAYHPSMRDALRELDAMNHPGEGAL